jgi:hypothetical protein
VVCPVGCVEVRLNWVKETVPPHTAMHQRLEQFVLEIALIVIAIAAVPSVCAEESAVVQLSLNQGLAGGSKARMNISGAACADLSTTQCLLVNDETNTAQFFSILKETIAPAREVLLLPTKDEEGALDEVDAEGVAYDDGYFYIVGSHGAGRNKGKVQRSRFFFFRIPAQSSDAAETAVKRTPFLRAIIQHTPELAEFAEQPLKLGGANIEGLAVDGGRVYFGFRAPVVHGYGYILETRLPFQDGLSDPQPHVHKIAMGEHLGIRDLAKVDGGLLILAAPRDAGLADAQILEWNRNSEATRVLAKLKTPAEGKPETFIVTETRKGAYDIVVMFDGLLDGAPVRHTIPR